MQSLRRFFSLTFALVLIVGMNPLSPMGTTPVRSQPLTAPDHPLAPLAVKDPGIDCECDTIGDFQDAIKGKSPKVNPDYTSPHGIFYLEVDYIGEHQIIITIKLSADGSTIATIDSIPGSWGFSPDDYRFAYWYIHDGMFYASLYNLELDTPDLPIWATPSTIASETDILFSPHGDYFYVAALIGQNETSVRMVNSMTGVELFYTEFFFSIPPGEHKLGVASYGFSPDSSDRTFVYSYLDGDNHASWNMINLKTLDSLSLPITDISTFWQFSQCGDRLGMVEEPNPEQVQTSLYKTLDGSLVNGSQYTTGIPSTILLTTDLVNHTALLDNTPYILGANTAPEACNVLPGLDTLSLDTGFVVGGNQVNGMVTLDGPAPAGGAEITLTSDHPDVATVPASVTVLEGETSAQFTVITTEVIHPVNAYVAASYRTDNLGFNLQVLRVPPPLESITVSSDTIEPGQTLTVTVSLQSAAPEGGAYVLLSSSPPDLVSLPEIFIIPAGRSSAQAVVVPETVSISTYVTLAVFLKGDMETVEVLLLPPMPDVETFSFDPTHIVGGSPYLVTGTITLTEEVPSGGLLWVNMSTIYTGTLDLPDRVGIYGGHRTGTFYVPTYGVAEPISATVTAKTHGISRSAEIEVLPADLQSLSIEPSCGVARQVGTPDASIAGHPIDVVVTLNGGAPPAGAVVQLSSNNPALVPVPAMLTIHESGGRITVQTGEIAQETIVSLTASYRAVTLQTPITLTVVPTYSLTSLALPFSPQFLNDEEQIAGDSYIYHDGEITDLNTEFNGLLGIIDINENGDLLVSGQIDGMKVNYYLEDFTPYLINPLDGFQDFVPEGMNDLGEVIGRVCNSRPSYMCKGFYWNRNEGATELEYDLERPITLPQDINNQGVIVGYSEQLDEHGGLISKMLKWVDGLFVPLNPYPVRSNQAIEINENGTIALHAGGPYFWKDGILTVLGMPFSYDYAQIRALNDNNELLVTALVNGDIPIWKDAIHNQAGTYSLSCAFDLEDGWDAYGIDINNNGQILGGIFQENPDGIEWINQEKTYYIFTPSGVTPPVPPKTKLFIPIIVSK